MREQKEEYKCIISKYLHNFLRYVVILVRIKQGSSGIL